MNADNPVERLRGRLTNVRPCGAGFTARCPAHDDRHNSLKVDAGEKGEALVFCHAGCPTPDIVAAVGLGLADLYPDARTPRFAANGRKPAAERTGQGQAAPPEPLGPIVAVYEYPEADGTARFRVTRHDPKTFRPWHRDAAGAWMLGAGGVVPPPYNLPAIVAADPDEAMFVFEGEKDCDRAAAEGWTATTNAGGAGKWRTAYAEALRDRHVVLVPDNDPPGSKHMAEVYRSLDGTAASVVIVKLTAVPPKGDVSDYLDQGGTLDAIHQLAVGERSRVLGAVLASLADLDAGAAGQAPNSQRTRTGGEDTGPEASTDPEDGEAPGASEDGEGSEGESEPWEPPTPLAEVERPDFPTHLLPEATRRFVEALALATQTPAALAALLCLAVLAAAAAKRVAVRVRSGWEEGVNLFVAVALPPGNRKTGVFREVVAPLEAHEAAEAARLAPEIAQATSRHKIAEQALAKKQGAASTAKTTMEYATLTAEADDLAKSLATMEIPEPPREIVDDCSPEKLANLLARQGGRIAAMSPEGGLFDMIAGRYSANGTPNLDVYLKGHAGDTLRVDRVGRPPEFVANPALTIGLAVQPEVIRGLAGKPGFRGRGLLGRFTYGMPHSLVGYRATNTPPVPDRVRAAYAAVVAAILALRPETEADGSPKPRRLTLGPAADAAFQAFERGLEPRLRDGGDLGHVKDWASKLAGLVARWAGLLHVAALAEDGDDAPWETPIDGATMTAAIRIGTEFLVPHALAAFTEMGADPAVEDARHILRWLEGRGLTTISRRDLHQPLRGRFERVEQIDPALAVLVEHGFLRRAPVPGGNPAHRPRSPLYEINPLWVAQNTHNPQKPPDRPTSEGFEGCEGQKGAESGEAEGWGEWTA